VSDNDYAVVPAIHVHPMHRIQMRLLLNLSNAGLTGVPLDDERVDDVIVLTVEQLMEDTAWAVPDDNQSTPELLFIAGDALTEEVYNMLTELAAPR